MSAKLIAEFWSQITAVIRIELTKTFFARRSMWIYLLALLPAALFYVNSIYTKQERARLGKIVMDHPISTADLRSIRPGMTEEQVVGILGEPYRKATRRIWSGRPPQEMERLTYFYTDGESDMSFRFNNKVMSGMGRNGGAFLLPQLQLVFAAVFQLYFIRLAIFFGCAGIFTNLFRGEMLDKSLHFYLLSPVPRSVLVAGKYVAALFATAIIFSASAALQFYAMLRGFDSAAVHEFMQTDGWNHLYAYVGVSALACVAYGSIFLAAGLIGKNPAVLAAILLLWESVNAFIPGSLKMASVFFYLQSLCPVEAPPDVNLSPQFLALVAPPEHVSTFTGIAVLAAVSLLMLVGSGLLARRLEINYSVD